MGETMRRSRFALAVVAASTAAVVSASAAAAQTADVARAPQVVTLTDRVLAPFQVAAHGTAVYVADGSSRKVSLVQGNGRLTTVGSQPGGPMADVAGVALSRTGRTVAWTSTDFEEGRSWLTLTRPDVGTQRFSLSDHEQRNNPDGDVHYGIRNPTKCQTDGFKKIGMEAGYTGIKDTHPYAVTQWSDYWVVADAGANALLKVDHHGRVSTLAVLPTQPVKITRAMAAMNGLPTCVVGATYAFEPVPTDVEEGPNGMLYVTTLPGGPEDPSAGARGSVYRVDPFTGESTRLATGFAGATNLAIGPDRTIYVAELFAGRISTVSRGKPKAYVSLKGALAVEVSGGHLYASAMAPMDKAGNPSGRGRVVEIRR
jgi:hypothetical protein